MCRDVVGHNIECSAAKIETSCLQSNNQCGSRRIKSNIHSNKWHQCGNSSKVLLSLDVTDLHGDISCEMFYRSIRWFFLLLTFWSLVLFCLVYLQQPERASCKLSVSQVNLMLPPFVHILISHTAIKNLFFQNMLIKIWKSWEYLQSETPRAARTCLLPIKYLNTSSDDSIRTSIALSVANQAALIFINIHYIRLTPNIFWFPFW